MITLDQARAAKAKAMMLLAAAPGFSGAGIGEQNGEYCVVVRFSIPPTTGLVPDAIDGVAVSMAVVGEIIALDPQ
jgi:hypothetical protein